MTGLKELTDLTGLTDLRELTRFGRIYRSDWFDGTDWFSATNLTELTDLTKVDWCEGVVRLLAALVDQYTRICRRISAEERRQSGGGHTLQNKQPFRDSWTDSSGVVSWQPQTHAFWTCEVKVCSFCCCCVEVYRAASLARVIRWKVLSFLFWIVVVLEFSNVSNCYLWIKEESMGLKSTWHCWQCVCVCARARACGW